MENRLGWIDEEIHRRTDGRTDGRADGWTGGRADGRTGGRADKGTSKPRGGHTDEREDG